MADGLLERLRAHIEAQPGTYDSKRALEACRAIGFYCTIQRARVTLKATAERYPGLLVAVEGTRWTWETPRPESEES